MLANKKFLGRQEEVMKNVSCQLAPGCVVAAEELMAAHPACHPCPL